MHSPLIKIYTAEEPSMCIQLAFPATSHWNHACRITVIFKIFLVSIMMRDRGHQNAFARANLMLPKIPTVKLRKSREREEGERGETFVLCATEEKTLT